MLNTYHLVFGNLGTCFSENSESLGTGTAIRKSMYPYNPKPQTLLYPKPQGPEVCSEAHSFCKGRSLKPKTFKTR